MLYKSTNDSDILLDCDPKSKTITDLTSGEVYSARYIHECNVEERKSKFTPEQYESMMKIYLDFWDDLLTNFSKYKVYYPEEKILLLVVSPDKEHKMIFWAESVVAKNLAAKSSQ